MDIEKFWKKVEEYTMPCDSLSQKFIYEGAGICEDFIREQENENLSLRANVDSWVHRCEVDESNIKWLVESINFLSDFVNYKGLTEEQKKKADSIWGRIFLWEQKNDR